MDAPHDKEGIKVKVEEARLWQEKHGEKSPEELVQAAEKWARKIVKEVPLNPQR
jgi:hypothetical protein